MMMLKSTPLMEQYQSIKKEHKDKILLFRMGDFFEMFGEDAEIAAPILNIALTCRNKKSGLMTKMCGVPHHSISTPISKLLSAGLSVAICDQIEAGGMTHKGLVKRAVTRSLSPGMVYDPETLDKMKANYMGAFDKNSISFCDLSTGAAFYYEIGEKSDFFKLLEQFKPSELVVSSPQKEKCRGHFLFRTCALSVFDKPLGAPQEALKKFSALPESAQRLVAYIYFMQGEKSLKILSDFKRQSLNKEMYYSQNLYTHLEIFKNYDGTSKDTLFSALNRTKTPGGTRLFRRRLQSPLIDKNKIEKRWDKVEWWMARPQLLSDVRKILSQMGDGERKIGKLSQSSCNGRDLLAIAEILDCGLKIEELATKSPWILNRQKAQTLKDRIRHVISPDCPVSLKEGGIINKGVNPQLDEWIELVRESQKILLRMEQKEQTRLGIPSLKIRYNNVFGYYIEVRKAHVSKVPPHYRRKQTLTQAERYATEDLNVMEEKILSARAKRMEMESLMFQDLKSELMDEISFLMKAFAHWSKVDIYSSLAFLSIENKYTRPRFASHFKLKASRHPVLEQKSLHEFVPNSMDLPAHQTVILTGPNMAGKSTLMRQMALTVLMAQCGCFVAAEQAEIPLFHKMFTRMGAGDLLSQGLSTFMLEMKETAEILEKADQKSFIVLDEIGRGTATFDGMSLAQSILEFLTKEKQPLLFSATHYQELTQLAERLTSVRNGSMAIREEEGNIHFLYFFQEGPANKSYGIQVARLAGLPLSVIDRADWLLRKYESQQDDQDQAQKEAVQNPADYKKKAKQLNTAGLSVVKSDLTDHKKKAEELLNGNQIQTLIKEISNYSLMTQSPIDAMNQINQWQKKIKCLQKASKKEAQTCFEGEFFPGNLN